MGEIARLGPFALLAEEISGFLFGGVECRGDGFGFSFECIDLSFSDTETSWDLHPNGEYVERNVFLKTKEAKDQSKTSINVQQTLMSKYGKFK